MRIITAAGEETVTASQFETDEHNNLCISVNGRCTRVYAVGEWRYVELDSGG